MKVHYQINPGGTFPVTACGRRILRCYAGKNTDVRPSMAFDASLARLRCKTCDRKRLAEKGPATQRIAFLMADIEKRMKGG